MLVERDELERKAATTLGTILRQVHTQLSNPFVRQSAERNAKALKALDEVTKFFERKSEPTTGESDAK